jgi:hypothetical protein
MAEKWIDFAHSHAWRGGESGHAVLVVGPEDRSSFATEVEYDHKYRNGTGQLMYELGWERCFRLGEMLQGCYSDDQ